MTSPPRTIGLVYFRTSTHQQFKKISPDLQRKECLQLAHRDGCEVDETRDIFWDDESAFLAKGGKRPGFRRLTERWKTDPRVRALYIYDLSRLFRDARGYFNYKFELDSLGVELVSVVEPLIRDNSPAGKLPAGIIALVNQYNSEIYGNKIKEAMRFKAESGIYPGKAPFGYRNVREEGEGKRRAWIEVMEEEASWVKRAFLLYSQGTYGIRRLSEQLAKEGFPTRNGRPLQGSVLEDILKDRIYTGWVEWGGVSNPNGKHERIVDEATFDCAGRRCCP